MELPTIFTANTYFWSPSKSAGERRRSEDKKIEEVNEFLIAVGFSLNDDGYYERKFKGCKIEVKFFYSESCANVYKSLSVYKDNKRSNVRLLKAIAASV